MNKDELVLAIETSGKIWSVSLFEKGTDLVTFSETENISLSSNLVLVIDELLKKSNRSKSDLSLIGIGVGPGSFTGLRVGVSVAKALSKSLNVKLVGLPILDILAAFNSNFEKDSFTFIMADEENVIYQINKKKCGYNKSIKQKCKIWDLENVIKKSSILRPQIITNIETIKRIQNSEYSFLIGNLVVCDAVLSKLLAFQITSKEIKADPIFYPSNPIY